MKVTLSEQKALFALLKGIFQKALKPILMVLNRREIERITADGIVTAAQVKKAVGDMQRWHWRFWKWGSLSPQRILFFFLGAVVGSAGQNSTLVNKIWPKAPDGMAILNIVFMVVGLFICVYMWSFPYFSCLNARLCCIICKSFQKSLTQSEYILTGTVNRKVRGPVKEKEEKLLRPKLGLK